MLALQERSIVPVEPGGGRVSSKRHPAAWAPDVLKEALNASHGVLCLTDEHNVVVDKAEETDDTATYVLENLTTAPSMHHVCDHRQTSFDDPQIDSLLHASGFHAYLSVPIRVDGKIQGWLMALDFEERSWSEHERAIALATAVALERNFPVDQTDVIDVTTTKMAHELRTPLTSIVGYLELVLDGSCGPLNDEQIAFISNAHRGALRMAHAIKATGL